MNPNKISTKRITKIPLKLRLKEESKKLNKVKRNLKRKKIKKRLKQLKKSKSFFQKLKHSTSKKENK